MGALDTIDQFYGDNYIALALKLSSNSRMRETYNDTHAGFTGNFDRYGLDYVDLQHQKAAFKELVAEFDKLRWYGHVNTNGFRKIIRKIRSLGTEGVHAAAQLERALCRLELATQAQCLVVLETLHEVIALITQAQQNFPKELPKVKDSFCARLARVNPFIPALLFFRSVKNEDSLDLGRLIDNTCKGDLDFPRTDFLQVLFQCLIRSSYHSWVDVMISRAISQDAVVVIESCIRNVIAELCWSTSKAQQANPSTDGTSLSLLTYILDRLLARNLDLLYKQDHLGRTPLHYACEGDSTEVCEIILKSMRAWEQFDAGDVQSVILLKDVQARSPLQISVLSGHLEVTELLTHFEGCNNRSELAVLRPASARLSVSFFCLHSSPILQKLLQDF